MLALNCFSLFLTPIAGAHAPDWWWKPVCQTSTAVSSEHLNDLLPWGYINAELHLQIQDTHTHTHTCFRIPAAISWPQSKMMWNSFPLFISFKSGLASLVSAGSCRIFNRMLYRDGAFISSCNRIRPVGKATKNLFFSFCLNSHYYFFKNEPSCNWCSLAPMSITFPKRKF